MKQRIQNQIEQGRTQLRDTVSYNKISSGIKWETSFKTLSKVTHGIEKL